MCYGLSFAMRNPNGFNMNKLEYFGKVIKVVTELMDVTDQAILGKSRSYEIVDARWMTAFLMHEKGYSSKQIATLMLRPVRTINHALSLFPERAKSFSLGNSLAIARQMLGNNQ